MSCPLFPPGDRRWLYSSEFLKPPPGEHPERSQPCWSAVLSNQLLIMVVHWLSYMRMQRLRSQEFSPTAVVILLRYVLQCCIISLYHHRWLNFVHLLPWKFSEQNWEVLLNKDSRIIIMAENWVLAERGNSFHSFLVFHICILYVILGIGLWWDWGVGWGQRLVLLSSCGTCPYF